MDARSRAACALVATAAAFGASATGAVGSSPRAPSSEQTHPHVRPSRGAIHTTFTLTLTAGDELGVRGVVQTSYSISAVDHQRGCKTPFRTTVTRAHKGQRLTLRLSSRHSGWCRGRYSGVVLLERGPYCPKPPAGKPPQPCPDFASQALDVGRFAFRVR